MSIRAPHNGSIHSGMTDAGSRASRRPDTQKSWRSWVSREIPLRIGVVDFERSRPQFFLRRKPERKAGQRLGSATETYYEQLPTIPPVVCNHLHEYRRLEHAGGNIAFQISFSLIPLDLGPSLLRSRRTVPRVVRLLDGGKAYGGRT